MLSGAQVCPGRRPVFVVDDGPILRQNGESKKDCGRNVAKRFFSRQARVNDLALNKSDEGVRVSILYCRVREAGG
jgi:hypothetical protein